MSSASSFRIHTMLQRSASRVSNHQRFRCFHNTRISRDDAKDDIRQDSRSDDPSHRLEMSGAANSLAETERQLAKTPEISPSFNTDRTPPTEAAKRPLSRKERQIDTAHRMRESVGISEQSLLSLGQGTSTLANLNHLSIYADHLETTKLRRRGIDVRYGSSESRGEVMDKFFVGKHDGDDLLGGKEKYKQETLNVVARAMTMNSTYIAADTARFVSKVRSLLPTATVPRKPVMNR